MEAKSRRCRAFPSPQGYAAFSASIRPFASLPLVGKSDKDGVSCSVKCAGQEIGQEEGGPEPGPDVRIRPSRDGGREAA